MDTSFHGIELTVQPGRVFTPRATTEALVDAALERVDGRPVRIADVGTGSGAIAVALALLVPEAEVWATDTSATACALARANVERHGLEERVHVLEGDLLEPVPTPVDLVVANLPYLPEETRDAPEHNEYRNEPPEAIYAPGDGLGPYRSLLHACEEGKLVEGGAVLIQFHRGILEADCWELDALRRRLEATARTAV